jgi:hypothetical protein
MIQGFNQARTPNYNKGGLRRSRLVKAGAGVATAAAIFAGCGQSGGQHNTDKLNTPSAPAKTNPTPSPNAAGQPQTTTTSPETGQPMIKSVCDIQELITAAEKFFGYSAVQCGPIGHPPKPGDILALLQDKGDTNTFVVQGTAEVAVYQEQTVFDNWSGNPALAAALHVEHAPDINGNTALWSRGGFLVTTYGSQEVDITVSDPPGRYLNLSQDEQFAVQAATIVEDRAGH